jgi:pimeloyl-ACP methyl ester carboxylesterase
MEEMGRRIPNAEVRIFPNTLHGFMVERPDAFNMIVDFLKRH